MRFYRMSITTPNIKISFFTPIKFDEDFLKEQKSLTKFLVAIGAASDSYLSLGKHYFKVNAVSMKELPRDNSAFITAIKVMSYVLTAFIFPAFALLTKALYRHWAIKNLPTIKTLSIQNNPNNALQMLPASQEITTLQILARHIRLPPAPTPKKAVSPTKKPLEEQTSITEFESPSVLNELILTNLETLKILKEKNDGVKDQLELLLKLEDFAIKEKAENGKTIRGSMRGHMMQQILHPELPLDTEITHLMEGQILEKIGKTKPSLPDSFYDLPSFVNIAIKKIIERNLDTFLDIIRKLPVEQRKRLKTKYLDITSSKGGKNLKKIEPPVCVRTRSGKVKILLQAEGINLWSKEGKFVATFPHVSHFERNPTELSLVEPRNAMWNQSRKKEIALTWPLCIQSSKEETKSIDDWYVNFKVVTKKQYKEKVPNPWGNPRNWPPTLPKEGKVKEEFISTSTQIRAIDPAEEDKIKMKAFGKLIK